MSQPALRAGMTRRSTLSYWRPTLVIACSPLDAGQTMVTTDKISNRF